MKRNFVSILFFLNFLIFLSAPTVISFIDEGVDISVFFSLAEEEENGSCKVKPVKDIILEHQINEDFVSLKEKVAFLSYYLKNYSKPHINLVSPPPKFA